MANTRSMERKIIIDGDQRDGYAPLSFRRDSAQLGSPGHLRVSFAGIVFGKPAFKKKIEPYHQVLRQILQVENAHQDLVVLGNVNIGHAYPTGILALGLPYEIDCEQKNIQAPGRKLSMTVFFAFISKVPKW